MYWILLLILYVLNIQLDVFFIDNIPLAYKFVYLWSNGYTILLILLLQVMLIVWYFKLNNMLINLLQFLIVIWIYIFYEKELLIFNPLLFSPFMIFHPMILYLSYSFMLVISCYIINNFLYINFNFYYNLVNLYQTYIVFNKIHYSEFTDYISRNHRSSLLSKLINISVVLSFISIILGALWAYCELGWGGLWFFDPVENLSLLPFISILAMLHNNSNIRSAWSCLNIISIFLSIVLVRTNLLVSVHTFANSFNNCFIYISLLYIIIFMIIFILVVWRLNVNIFNYLFYENLIWFLFYLILLIVIIYPVLYKYFTGSVVVLTLDFFNIYFIGFVFLMLFFMLDGWLWRFSCSLALSILFISQYHSNYFNFFKYGYGLIISCWGICHAFVRLYQRQSCSRYISHLGVFLVSFFMILYANCFYENIYYLDIKDIKYSKNNNYIEQKICVNFENRNYYPRVWYYDFEKVTHSKLDMKFFFWYDIQVFISDIHDDYVRVMVRKIYYVKMIVMSFIMIFVGLYSRRN
ncbi:MAG: cytochrome c biogenesis protein CcsA [Pseudomonadota bacterium]